ncbi:hypothetical protein PG987_007269, partial [Apiospora arundinis]
EKERPGIMEPYTIQQEASRIFHDVLLPDARLGLPPEVHAAASRVSFATGTTITRPFIPVPTKVTECSAALWALLATYANAIVAQRFGGDNNSSSNNDHATPVRDYQNVVVDSDAATAFTFSFLLLKLNGKQALADPTVVATRLPWRRLCTNLYQCGDGRWYHTHGGLDAGPSLRMLGLPTHRPELTTPDDDLEIVATYAKQVREKFDDADWLDTVCNEHWRQAGTLRLTAQEYRESAQGRAVGMIRCTWSRSPTWTPYLRRDGDDENAAARGDQAPRPHARHRRPHHRAPRRPLRRDRDPGIPLFAAGAALAAPREQPGQAGRRPGPQDGARARVLRHLLEDADVVLDGYRPGALARLGFGPDYVRALARRRGRGIVYARENCYGWRGPWAHRSGWQMISDAVTGLAWEFGKFMGVEGEPIVPPLPNSDFQTGVVGCLAIMNALDRRAKRGGNHLVSVSLSQYNSFLISLGFHEAAVRDELREMWDDCFRPRHYDDMHRMLTIFNRELPKKAPSLYDPKHMMSMKAELGVEDEIMDFLGPPVSFDVTRLGYDVGSCERGTHKPEWPATRATGRE